MRAAPEKTGRRAKLLYAASILGAVLLGWIVGHASSQGPQVRAPTSSEAGAARTAAGVPLAFPDTAAGAAEAVASYQRSFATPHILRPGVLKERIEAVATPDYVETMLAANSPGAERLIAGPLGEGIAAGVETIYAAVPIGYRIESFTPERSRILTWGFTLLGNASAVEPSAYFGLTHTEVVWQEDSWKIAETKARFGPTPKLATPPGPLGGYGVLDVAAELRSYALAP